MNLFEGQDQRHTHREQTLRGGGEGEGGMNWESNTDIYTLRNVKKITSCNLLYSTGAQLGAL